MLSNMDELISAHEAGEEIDYLFFWGHQKGKKGLSKSCFSQWYEAAFNDDGVRYPTAEHYMMAEKARLFDDDETLEKIIGCHTPGEAKKLGRGVKNFDEQLWLEHRFDIVVRASRLKFSQNPDMKRFLLTTEDRVLVEASPHDRIWGIGLAATSPEIEDPTKWKGLNLLGFALMVVRSELG